MLVMMMLLTSCKSIQRLTYKNQDFEFVNKKMISKVVIQSTRDKGFRFLVTDEKTIAELYNSLSSAMPVGQKKELEPDYIFEFHNYDTTIRKFYYIAGASNDDSKGNLYNDEKTYLVMNRIDNEIIKNLLALRKPAVFSQGYYGGITTLLKRVKQDYPDKSIAVMINEDTEMLKYHLSYEIRDFETELKNMGISLVRKNTDADVVMNVHTVGYNSKLIKIEGEVKDNIIRKEKNYYLRSDYKDKVWSPSIIETRPDDF